MNYRLRAVALFRAVLWALVAIAALVVWARPSAVLPEPLDVAAALDFAEQNFDTNNSNAQGAPQQQVVNGWYTADLLQILAAQADSAIMSQQAADSARGGAANMLLVFGLGACIDMSVVSLLRLRRPKQGQPVADGVVPSLPGPTAKANQQELGPSPTAHPVGEPQAGPPGQE